MDLKIAENYERLKTEVTTHWKTGVAMIGVAIVVGKVYGRVAAVGVVLVTVSNYHLIGQQIRVISWMSLRKTLIAVVLFGNSYFSIINPHIMSYIAVALVLIDNFQLSSINIDLSEQNETLEQNNKKLQEAHASLKTLEQELEKLLKPARELKVAKDENNEIVITLDAEIPEDIQTLPARLQNVCTLLKQLQSTEAMKEMMAFEIDLRSKISAMLQVFNQFNDELRPLTEKVEDLSGTLVNTVSSFQTNVTITGQQIVALTSVLKAVQNYSQRR